MSGTPGRDLLEGFVRGDQTAFEALFRQLGPEVYGWILRIVRDASVADEVLVEAFWRAYRGRARFDPTRSFGAWMRRVATNAALDHLKRARRRPDHSAPADGIAAPAGADPDVVAAVSLAFGRLPEKLRVVATLALIEELPYAEIADALALPVGTVKSRVFRATRRLRDDLTRMGIRQ